ncbi:MAG: 50S ribosomal protein L9 [Candidatus Azambacteria bacterium GW2011_GWE1_42_9]|nr:MAG: 50S ribosomal protein L9 [Candidatus Azambacteria bacterium GW2011_GWF1_41_10]KKS49079.1 MAG: 50S ribosomal protein L9 [Candidatus Azambacteria bacterium GW2011_GWF2_42_22]KKS69770.1 MAG: 50S ribosomal protein L9 [Candidatus Azambacteria bacterium GW2011_GWA2_42_62]KKS74273.1 MAG: 50S ribosomal protein L9 [Candidatus Azambacteria bacterium GW2011_GWB1_42_72]KKS79424.1 MAG: 50S ribosomal protein L9 [Candidatus Azambacteria bacterium GW2011_GWE1_42_9]KKT03341.1 MAG: 50S ribosomal protein
MKVALLQDVPDLGKRGETKEVNDGYGRNFLIRNKLAEILTPDLARKLEQEKNRREKTLSAIKNNQSVLKEKIENLRLIIKMKTGETGKTFGSVTPAKIASELEKNGLAIEKNQIMAQPIKTLGEHRVKIKLLQGMEVELKITIEH